VRYLSAVNCIEEIWLIAKTRRDRAVSREDNREADIKQIPEVPERNNRPIWELFDEFTEDLPEEVLAKLPTDGAEQHDHYLYGTPKRQSYGEQN
jgi:hypothetical protein